MTDARTRVPAIGGERSVPEPDPVARDYLLLALRLDQRDPGLVDGYYGPADLKARVDLEPVPSPARLAADAAALRERVSSEVADPGRRAWLEAQLVALATRAGVLAGEPIPYLEQVERGYAWLPTRRPESLFAETAAELERLIPGAGPLAERLATWDERFIVDPERLPAVVDWLVAELRRRALPRFGMPTGESVRVGLVRDQPWSGYDWYDGGLRSRVDLNLDLPVRAPELVATLAHETYAGHHAEHAWKEVELVERRGWLESSVLLLLTPECLISEGLASLGPDLLLPAGERAELLEELLERSGLWPDDAVRRRDAATASAAVSPLRRRLAEVDVNAALLRHVEGASSETTLAYLRTNGCLPDARARKRLEFIEDPRWRTYVFVYHEGYELLDQWVALVPPAARDARFGRLLREPLTPAAIAAELRAP